MDQAETVSSTSHDAAADVPEPAGWVANKSSTKGMWITGWHMARLTLWIWWNSQRSPWEVLAKSHHDKKHKAAVKVSHG
jgi:hypothetical protein